MGKNDATSVLLLKVRGREEGITNQPGVVRLRSFFGGERTYRRTYIHTWINS